MIFSVDIFKNDSYIYSHLNVAGMETKQVKEKFYFYISPTSPKKN
jgi:hypothetical protein